MYALSETLTIAGAPGTIGFSSAINAAIITGGEGDVGAMVANTHDPATGGDMAYTLSGAVTSGDGSVLTSASGTIAPGDSQANTVSVFSENVGENTVTLTATSDDATNSPQSTTATLTVLAHSDARFQLGGGSAAQSLSDLDNALLIDFGLVAQGAGLGALHADLSLLNFETVSGFTAALDLDFIESGYGDENELILEELLDIDAAYGLFEDLDAGDDKDYNILFDTTIAPGGYEATYFFKLSDQDGLSGATPWGDEILTLTVQGTVAPEPATLALLGLGGLGMLLARNRK